MAPLLPLLPGVCGGAAITGAVAIARPGVVMVGCSMTLAFVWRKPEVLCGDFMVIERLCFVDALMISLRLIFVCWFIGGFNGDLLVD